jgi:thioredoxin 2
MTFYIKCASCGSINRADKREGERPVCGKCRTALDAANATSDQPVLLSDNAFNHEVAAAQVPVLVVFFATWCGACRSLEPSLDSIAARYKGKLKVAKLDVERNPQNAAKYQIRATPTLIVFQNGNAAERIEGALPEAQLDQLVKKYVA